MSHSPDKEIDLRELRKWANRYARSRTIPFLVQWVFIVALVMVVGIFSFGMFRAFQMNNRPLLWFCVGGLALTTSVLTWFSVAKWGGDAIWRISQWLYGREGYAAYDGGHGPRPMRMAWLIMAAAGVLAAYHLAGAIVLSLHYVQVRYVLYAQPLSAVGMAPFLALMIVSQRLGFWAWVWPVCYALHAMAMLAGAPHFPPPWWFLDIIVPIFGYGLLSILAGHFYSRYALRRLKALARAGLIETPDGYGDEGNERP